MVLLWAHLWSVPLMSLLASVVLEYARHHVHTAAGQPVKIEMKNSWALLCLLYAPALLPHVPLGGAPRGGEARDERRKQCALLSCSWQRFRDTCSRLRQARGAQRPNGMAGDPSLHAVQLLLQWLAFQIYM